MPRMKFSDIYQTIENVSKVTSQRALVKDAIQWGLDELTSHDLDYLLTDGVFTTIAPYTTGTVSATNGSKTVTGSGTTFTSAMVNRKIRIDNQSEYYRIAAFVSTTEVTLETTYEGTTVSDKTFSIYKDEYRLAPDVDVYRFMRDVENNTTLISLDKNRLDFLHPSQQGEGTPLFEVFVGTKLDTYTTGTISGSVASSTVTGSSTAWTSVQGLGKGTRLTVGTNVYTVKSVDSDTQITIYETLSSALSAASYSLSMDNIIVQLSDIPDDAINIYYRYQRIPFPLINDQDIPDLPEKYHNLLITYGLMWVWATKDKSESTRMQQLFEKGKQEMWNRMGHVSRTRKYSRKSIDELFISVSPSPRIGSNYNTPLSL